MSHDASLPKPTTPTRPGEAAFRWTGMIAVTTAILAALASIASLLSGYHTDEAMIEQIRAADKWNEYQAKSIKGAVLESKMDLLPALGKEVPPADVQNKTRYESEKQGLMGEAKGFERSADDHRRRHKIYGMSVSALQIAIALCAIALLTKRMWFWALAVAGAAAGVAIAVYGAMPVGAG
jgi:hypothetical protein